MRLRDIPKRTLKGLVLVYRYAISPLIIPSCRFYPTCSAYAMEAIEAHGAAKGAILATIRICKCHPWYKGHMIDAVPASIDWRGIIGYKRAKPDIEKNCACANHEAKE